MNVLSVKITPNWVSGDTKMGEAKIAIFMLTLLCTGCCTNCQFVNKSEVSSNDVMVMFHPESIGKILEGETVQLTVTIQFDKNTTNITREDIKSEDGRLIIIPDVPARMTVGNRSILLDPRDVIDGVNHTVTLRAHKLGYVTLSVFWIERRRGQLSLDDDSQWEELDLSAIKLQPDLLAEYKLAVIRPDTTANKIFMNCLAVIVALNVFAMGTHLNMEGVKKVLQRPLGPLAGFISQFIFMPLAAYFLGWVLLQDEDMRVGLFFMGCAPGEIISNFWTLKLDGDFDLSVTMTLINTVAAVAMMPLWIFTLGQSITKDPLKVPFIGLLIALVRVTLPVAAGIILTRLKPQWSKKLVFFIRPLTVFIIVCTLALGVYCNLYAFEMMTWQVFMAGIGVAWGGYVFGGLLSYVFGLKKEQLLAVSIETAFQNVGLTLLAIRATLPQPDADIAIVPPIAQVLITSLPVHMCIIYFAIKRCCDRRKEKRNGESNQPGENLLDDQHKNGDLKASGQPAAKNGATDNRQTKAFEYRVSKFIDEDAASVLGAT